MKRKAKKTNLKTANLQKEKLPLVEHLHELRRRIFYIALTVAVGSITAYALERKLISVLLHPSHGQKFIYTSPLGGINFLFSVCTYVGLIVATPVIVYQLLAFIQPLMKETTRKFLLLSSAAAGIVACGGVLFGYFVGLPSALQFLLHQFTSIQVRPLITIQSYIAFVAMYLVGSALMFQLPLILIFINRIKPLKPSGLFKYERHLIAGAFVVAFIMNPTPNIIDQMIVVVPIILMYQLSIGIIWFVNRGKKPSHVQLLREQDAQRQAERANRHAVPLVFASAMRAETVEEVPVQAATKAQPTPDTPATRPRTQYARLRSQLVQ
jgi:sec-independent protein translocase protein TatC